MGLSLNQAAKQGKVAKTTLLRALQNGDISGEKTDNGQWKIESSELVRWLSNRTSKPRVTADKNILDHHQKTTEKPPENNDISLEVKLLRERLTDKDKTIDDLRTRLDAEANERRQLTKQITDQRLESAQERKSLWKRVFGG